jgi:hypothetical protein
MWSALTLSEAKPRVISWAASGQKHHALRAGISTSTHYRIGSDDRVIDYVPARDGVLLSRVVELLHERDGKPHFSRTAIAEGNYHPRSVESFGPMRHAAAEAVIAIYRRGRRALLDLALWCAPSIQCTCEQEIPMIDPIDDLAARLLGSIARGSSIRATDGKMFWSGFFERRIQRFARLPLADFVSRMMAECQCSPSCEGSAMVTDQMSGLDDVTAEAVSTSIRKRTSLVLALSYNYRKDAV